MKTIIAILIILIATPSFAGTWAELQATKADLKATKADLAQVKQNLATATADIKTEIEDQRNAYDYGLYLDIIALETPATEWGMKTTYAVEDSEVRQYVGGKIYLGRLLKGNK